MSLVSVQCEEPTLCSRVGKECEELSRHTGGGRPLVSHAARLFNERNEQRVRKCSETGRDSRFSRRGMYGGGRGGGGCPVHRCTVAWHCGHRSFIGRTRGWFSFGVHAPRGPYRRTACVAFAAR